MKARYPIKPELFHMRLDSFVRRAKGESMMLKIAPIAASECSMILNAYYGSKFKAGWTLIRQAINEYRVASYYDFVIGICDKVGWTKLHLVPGSTTERPFLHRHGRKCHGSPNCQDMHCMDKSIPRWFKWITRWDK